MPHNTGGMRYKSGLEIQQCVTCGKDFQPSRSKQLACSMKCYRKSPAGFASADRQNSGRRLAGSSDVEKRRAENFRQNIRKYGLTVPQYEAKLAAQNGVCMICGKPPRENGKRAAARLHIDHDHVTGAIRDLLCLSCNRGAGYFKDDPALMRAAAEYIERHRKDVD